ncbi:hypothetical protein [Acinetobacter sp. ANC 3882]|uniref:hypothetical protein n=1 Tax=Acinetobacter sp. ANC 3882 TaxID=2923423 RepID=UPI001F4A33C0|nr:hypothetical protein [Acinetobacter sp. ANC 3882]MCH7316222.1 hypothetical protein [Acinetobacter sp. ANC 3882]
MKIYEMVFQKGLDESTSFFCDSNSETSRRYFLGLMREEVDRELKDFKDSCIGGFSQDMLLLFEEVYRESHFHLDVMETEFIESGTANFCETIFVIVEERELTIVKDEIL